MRRCSTLAGCVMLVGLCAGCTVDRAAKLLVARPRKPGISLFLPRPSAEQLRKDGRISAHKICHGADGVAIDVWVVNARDKEGKPAKARATMLILHGLHQDKAKYLGIGERLAKKGYDAVLPDLRAHGDSGGQYVTYAVKEKHDLKAVIDALLKDKLIHPDVYVFGQNLSAGVAIHYASIDSRCKGVMAVAPYAGLRDIARYWYPLMSPKDFEAVLAKAGKLAGIDPAATSTAAAAAKLKCPIIISHGLLDASAPREHAVAVHKAAAGPKKLLTPGPGHVLGDIFVFEDWIADQMDALAAKGLKE